MKKLTLKQNNFCNYYIETGNASGAYRRAYFCDRMKDSTINRKAYGLLQQGHIRAMLDQLQSELQQRSNITKDNAIEELSNIVRSRITDVLDVKGDTIIVKRLSDLPDNIISCIASVKNVRDGIEIKLYDRITAIDRLSKMLGWESKKEIDVQGTISTSWLESMSNDELDAFIKSASDEEEPINKTDKE